MKKLLLFLLLVLSISIFANGSNNPNNKIYNDIDYWYGLGLIDRLPPIRPYSSQYIIHILNIIVENGDDQDVIKAKNYLAEYSNTRLDMKVNSKNFYNFDIPKTVSSFGIDANVNPIKNVYANIDVNINFMNITDSDFFPAYRELGIDFNIDDSDFSVMDIDIGMYQGLNMSSSFGNENMWFQSGIMRTGFGPLFSDSVVLNPSSQQSTHFSYTWMHNNFTLSYLFLPILASDNEGNDLRDNKYLAIRSYDFYFTKWWNFQFFESVIYGRSGVKPEYLIPFGQFFYSAGMSQTLDVNSMMGISSVFNLPQNINLKSTLYLDDVNFKEVVKLNFDSKMKLAGQFVGEWNIRSQVLKTLSLGYTAILPYMYTHIDYEDNSDRVESDYNENQSFNYQNYTHAGKTLGPYNMDPNSDKITLVLGTKLPLDLLCNFNLNLIRHGNATPDDSDSSVNFPSDGTIFDPGFSSFGRYMYTLSNPFLTQDIIETTLMGSLNISTPNYTLGSGEISFGAGYTYSFTNNKDLIDGKTQHENLVELSFEYKF
ncbi:MAG: hypothetical protein JXR64_09645 [Spirochaetales bacterium]|nr:hypothetical protein [Spirochaetales bacterium]